MALDKDLLCSNGSLNLSNFDLQKILVIKVIVILFYFKMHFLFVNM
jgi:hypothetical protein